MLLEFGAAKDCHDYLIAKMMMKYNKIKLSTQKFLSSVNFYFSSYISANTNELAVGNNNLFGNHLEF